MLVTVDRSPCHTASRYCSLASTYSLGPVAAAAAEGAPSRWDPSRGLDASHQESSGRNPTCDVGRSPTCDVSLTGGDVGGPWRGPGRRGSWGSAPRRTGFR